MMILIADEVRSYGDTRNSYGYSVRRLLHTPISIILFHRTVTESILHRLCLYMRLRTI